MSRALALALLSLVPVLGCGKRASPEARRAVRIGELATVDAPPGWEVAAAGKQSYRVGAGPGEQVFVREVAFPPATLDELYATECARAAAPGTKATTPAGALIVECTLPSTTRAGKAIELVHVAALLRAGGRAIKCHFGIAGDAAAAAAAAAVCRSLRP